MNERHFSFLTSTAGYCFEFQPGRILHMHYQLNVFLDGPVVNAGLAAELVHARVLIRDEVKQLHQEIFIDLPTMTSSVRSQDYLHDRRQRIS